MRYGVYWCTNVTVESNAESEVVRIIDLVDTRSNPETLPERLKNAVGNKV